MKVIETQNCNRQKTHGTPSRFWTRAMTSPWYVMRQNAGATSKQDIATVTGGSSCGLSFFYVDSVCMLCLAPWCIFLYFLDFYVYHTELRNLVSVNWETFAVDQIFSLLRMHTTDTLRCSTDNSALLGLYPSRSNHVPFVPTSCGASGRISQVDHANPCEPWSWRMDLAMLGRFPIAPVPRVPHVDLAITTELQCCWNWAHSPLKARYGRSCYQQFKTRVRNCNQSWSTLQARQLQWRSLNLWRSYRKMDSLP